MDSGIAVAAVTAPALFAGPPETPSQGRIAYGPAIAVHVSEE